LDNRAFVLFKNLYQAAKAVVPVPDKLIFLHRHIEDLQNNIQQRGRTYEQQLSSAYLLQLQQSYENTLEQMNDMPILCVNAGQIDFKVNLEKRKELFATIDELNK